MRTLFISMCILLMPMIITAEEPAGVVLRGELLTDQRVFTGNENDWAWNENRLDLRLSKRTDRIRFNANVWLRHLGVGDIGNTQSLQSRDNIYPWNLNIREAYVEVRGFLADNLDLKIGQQLINWGTADFFNPTNMLNSADLEDAMDFGRKNGTLALNLTWFFHPEWSLQGVYIPRFSPANLPIGEFGGMFHSQIALPQGLILHQYSDNVQLPRNNFTEGATVGARLKGFVLGTDISISYIYGREQLPLANTVFISSANILAAPAMVNINSNVFFPRYHMAGADFAGTIGNVGVWGEAALFFPEKDVVLTTDFSQLHGLPIGTPGMSQDSLLLSDEPFLRYIVGFDYTFPNGIYLNVQYLHGFFHERGRGNQNDYLLVALERSFFGNRLLLRPLAGGIAIANWDNPNENHALFFTPEIFYRGIDNLELGIGAFIFDGKGSNIFAGFRHLDMITVSARMSF